MIYKTRTTKISTQSLRVLSYREHTTVSDSPEYGVSGISAVLRNRIYTINNIKNFNYPSYVNYNRFLVSHLRPFFLTQWASLPSVGEIVACPVGSLKGRRIPSFQAACVWRQHCAQWSLVPPFWDNNVFALHNMSWPFISLSAIAVTWILFVIQFPSMRMNPQDIDPL